MVLLPILAAFFSGIATIFFAQSFGVLGSILAAMIVGSFSALLVGCGFFFTKNTPSPITMNEDLADRWSARKKWPSFR